MAQSFLSSDADIYSRSSSNNSLSITSDSRSASHLSPTASSAYNSSCHSISSSILLMARPDLHPNLVHWNRFRHPGRLGRPRHCQSVSLVYSADHHIVEGIHSLLRITTGIAQSRKHKIKTNLVFDPLGPNILTKPASGPSTERLRDSLVPWHCHAACQQKSFIIIIQHVHVRPALASECSSASRCGPHSTG